MVLTKIVEVMPGNIAFFSYSRVDSGFALKLAKDLRNAGIELWIDQLDIKPGSHWDASIENGLNAANSMLVILSPDAVASNNVMDEVSYALECGKRIIPILLKDCNTPFRLRRLQRIDFTGDYNIGFNQLLETLTHSEGNNTSREMTGTGPIKEIEPVQQVEPNINPAKFSAIPVPHVLPIPEGGSLHEHEPVERFVARQPYQTAKHRTLHIQRLFSLIIAGLTLVFVFLPWSTLKVKQSGSQTSDIAWYNIQSDTVGRRAFELSGFRNAGLISIAGILGVIIISLISNKSQPFKGKTKTFAMLSFGVIVLGAVIHALFNSGSGTGFEMKPAIGIWLTLISGLAGLAIASGLLKPGR